MEEVAGMAIFARVVEASSFSAAARRLGLSKAAVSKHVARLERRLGARLLNRTTRRLSLTEVGRAFYEHCARLVSEAEAAELEVSQLRSEPRGLLKVATSVAFGNLHIAPAIAEFLKRYPEVSVQMSMDDSVMDLAKEGYDVAVRMSSDPPPNVVARRLAPVRWVLCASPQYLQKRGTPRTPADLVGHNCLFYSHLEHGNHWHFRSASGEVNVRITGSFSVHSSLALREVMLSGLGIGSLPTFTVWRDIHEGAATVLLPDYELLGGNAFYAVYLPTRHVVPKVRAFIDFLVERFSPEPYWDRRAVSSAGGSRSNSRSAA
jgi:DNA-binding transcriptional LysR family regulator